MAGLIERAFARGAPFRAAQASSAPAIPPEVPQCPPTNAEPTAPHRRRVHVNSISERHTFTKWMTYHAADHGEIKIISKTNVKQFRQHFSGNQEANLQKCSRWWRNRAQTMSLKSSQERREYFSAVTSNGIKRARFKRF